MNPKGLWIGVGVTAVLSLAALVLALRSPVSVFVSGLGSGGAQVVESEQTFGGTTGLGSLSLTGDLTVAGVSSFTGSLGAINASTIASTGVTASSVTIGTSGGVIDFARIATSTIDADALTAWSTTTSVVTVTGAKANDICNVSNPYSASGTVVRTSGRAGTDNCTIDFYSATATASFNPSSGVFIVEVVSPPTN